MTFPSKMHSSWFAFFLCLAAGCGKKAEDPEKTPPAPVKAEKARTLFFGGWVELLGTTQPTPNGIARLTAQVDGQVESILVGANNRVLAEGQEIDAGTVVTRLDTRIIVEQKKQAVYALEQAQIEVNRLQELRASSTRSQVPLVSPVEIQKARLALQDAQSKLKALDDQIKLFEVQTPIKGRLGQIQVTRGQRLTAGTAVTEVVNLDEIDVLCFVPPSQTSRVELNQPARLTGQEAEATAVEGKVVYIGVLGQSENGLVPVKVRFPNDELKLGANVVARVSVQERQYPEKKRTAIPETALMEDSAPPTVVVIQDLQTVTNPETKKEEQVGTARILQATVGVRFRPWKVVEITALKDPKDKKAVPIKDGMLFITEGGAGLQDGDKVKLDEDED